MNQPRIHREFASVPLAERFWEKVQKTDGCWIWTAHKDKCGYGKIKMNDATDLAHRVAWTLTYGSIPDGLCVLHHCDNPPCVNPAHLFLGTQQDNIDDMHTKKRWKHPEESGERNPNSKLTQQQVNEIRLKYAQGLRCLDLSKEYHVSDKHIWRIVARKEWRGGE